MKNIDLNYYEGWTRKAISFTIDDGSLKLDKKFIDIVKPYGIKGTFNLISNFITEDKREAYRELYSDYEIANHMKFHPMGLRDGFEIKYSAERFDPETADKRYLYKSDRDGQYFYYVGSRWFYAVDNESYIRLVNEGKAELEDIFGVGRIKDFVWPYGLQSQSLQKEIKKLGYRSVRGTVYQGFDLPLDRGNWGFYADCNNMAEKADSYDALADDGKLKALIFGVHSQDFENSGKWGVLEDFCRKLGNRPHDFFYGTVGDIFDREDAIRAARVSDKEIINDSPIPLYVKVDGKKILIEANEKYKI